MHTAHSFHLECGKAVRVNMSGALACSRQNPLNFQLARQPLVTITIPTFPGTTSSSLLKQLICPGAVMPDDQIFLYSIEPHTAEVRIQINGTSVLL
jgi:hypothetical protein